MIDADFSILHINISKCQPNKFRDMQPSLKQDIYTLIVSAKMLIVRHKFKKSSFLLSCDCFSCHTVIYNNSSKLKFKRIFAYQIIINRHLKCRPNDTPYRVNGAVTPSVFLQFYQPTLFLRQFNLVNSSFLIMLRTKL